MLSALRGGIIWAKGCNAGQQGYFDLVVGFKAYIQNYIPRLKLHSKCKFMHF